MNEEPRVLESPVGARVRLNGREVDYFCGTSYYGLHGHPAVISAACAALREYGVGAATAIPTPAHREVEARLAQFLAVDSILHVASGYLAPLALLQALAGDVDVAFVDRAAHFGEMDALRSIGKPIVPFRHRDPEDLAHGLAARPPHDRALVMTDGVFPSTGAIAPLRDYAEVVGRRPGTILCVDDAHGLGVLGAHGRGALEHCGVEATDVRLCGTLSKAFGGSGGFVPGSREFIACVRARSPVLRGASAPSVAAAAAAAAGIRLLAEHPEMRRSLWDNAHAARDALRRLGFDLDPSPVPIISLRGRPELDLRRTHADLARQGVAVSYVPPRGYSDAPDVESLRIAIFATHSREQIGQLAECLRRSL